MKRIVYLLLFIAIGTSSCDDYLDVVPKGKIIPQATNDYRLLLNQTEYQGGSDGIVNCYSADVLMSDDLKVTAVTEPTYGDPEKNLLSFSEHIYDDGAEDLNWKNLYNHIYIANVVIEEVLDSEGGTEAEKLELYAEAKVHRAFAYWSLINLYAKHYNAATAHTDLGVPLRSNIDFEERLPRASVQEVYDQILEDLTSAVNHLPDTQNANYNYRPAKASAYGMLARVYLYMQQYEAALENVDLSIQYANTLLDYNTVNVFTYPIILENPEVLLWKQNTGGGFVYLSDPLLSLYDPQNDLRMQVGTIPDFIVLEGLNYGMLSTKWFFQKYPVMGYTTPESYLLRAEVNARLGNVDDALQDLNHLRQYRYLSGSDYELSADAAGILPLVKEERRRELAFQGQRLFDIKRYNQVDGDQISLSHTLLGETYTLEAGDVRFVLPIARKYIELNPEIQQNPR